MNTTIIIRNITGWFGPYFDMEDAQRAKNVLIKDGDSLGMIWKADELTIQECVETTNADGFIVFVPVGEWEAMNTKHIGSVS